MTTGPVRGSIENVDAEACDLVDDDFVFEPDTWDLASWIGPRIDSDTDRAALAELADAMLVSLPDGPELERLTSAAMGKVWTESIRVAVREGLVALADNGEWRAAAESALAELDRDPHAAEIAREVTRWLAMELAHEDAPFFCVHCLDLAVEAAPPGERRRLARVAAILARRDAAVPRNRVATAARMPHLMEGLGTVDRRRAVRRRLGRIGSLGRQSLPSLAPQLRALAEEPLPGTAAEDDVWAVVAGALLEEVVQPRLN
jgi:hypothetical protein